MTYDEYDMTYWYIYDIWYRHMVCCMTDDEYDMKYWYSMTFGKMYVVSLHQIPCNLRNDSANLASGTIPQ